MEKNCDVILMTIFCDVVFMTSKNNIICDFLNFHCVIVNFRDQKLAKSRNFRSLRQTHTKNRNYLLFYLFDLAKKGDSDGKICRLPMIRNWYYQCICLFKAKKRGLVNRRVV